MSTYIVTVNLVIDADESRHGLPAKNTAGQLLRAIIDDPSLDRVANDSPECRLHDFYIVQAVPLRDLLTVVPTPKEPT